MQATPQKNCKLILAAINVKSSSCYWNFKSHGSSCLQEGNILTFKCMGKTLLTPIGIIGKWRWICTLWNIQLALKGKYLLFLINLASSMCHQRGYMQYWWLLSTSFSWGVACSSCSQYDSLVTISSHYHQGGIELQLKTMHVSNTGTHTSVKTIAKR